VHKDDAMTSRPTASPQARKPCFRCGKAAHPRGTDCLASGATCKRCKRKGHFASQCFSTTIRLLTNELPTANEIIGDVIAEEEDTTVDPYELSLDTAFLDAVTSGKQMSPWTSTTFIEDIEADFKLDTGAEATAITMSTYNSLPSIELQKPKKTLLGPAQQPLDVLGQFQATLCYKQR